MFYGNPMLAAYQEAQAAFDSGFGAVQAAIDKGLFAVVFKRAAYCPSTDAYMGVRYALESTHATREAAGAALAELIDPDDFDGELDVLVYPLLPTPPAPACDDLFDDIPF